MMATMLAIVDPGDEVIVFEPFYENYGPDAILSGATPRFVQLLRAVGRRRLVVRSRRAGRRVHRTGRARSSSTRRTTRPARSSRARSSQEIAALCQQWDVIAVTDEIYEHILYDGATHVPMASLDGMAERTVTINSVSKTFSVTGWRVGWTIAPPDITGAIRKVHDFLTVGAAAPLQAAAAAALGAAGGVLRGAGGRLSDAARSAAGDPASRRASTCYAPHGAYYIMTDIAGFGFPDDVAFARHLVTDIGVAAVPGSSFYRDPASGRTQLRFCFCKKDETLTAAADRLQRLRVRSFEVRRPDRPLESRIPPQIPTPPPGWATAFIGPAIIGAAVWCAAGHITVVDPASASVAAGGAGRLVGRCGRGGARGAGASLAASAGDDDSGVAGDAAVVAVPLPPLALLFTGPLAWLPIGVSLVAAVFP